VTLPDPAPVLGAPALSVTRSSLLSALPWLVHGVTGRVPGLGRADGNLGYSPPRDVADAWAMRRRWSEAVGVDPERLVAAGQVHGAAVLPVEPGLAGVGARPGSGRAGLADALIADRPGVALLSLHADCLPILLADPRRRAIAVVHAGWRGTVADVAGAAVRTMEAAYGSRPGDLVAYLGPAIGPCCYEVGPEVATTWSALAKADDALALRPAGERWRFDLRRANAALLRRAGLDPERMEQSAVCTRCAGDAWFSHRGQGPTTGRFGAIIGLIG
jgi:YfiH family protein